MRKIYNITNRKNMIFKKKKIDDIKKLKQDWKILEKNSSPSFFLSWGWIGTLLKTLPAQHQPTILLIEKDEKLIGLALLFSNEKKRHIIVNSQSLHLNNTGNEYYDYITSVLIYQKPYLKIRQPIYQKYFCSNNP